MRRNRSGIPSKLKKKVDDGAFVAFGSNRRIMIGRWKKNYLRAEKGNKKKGINYFINRLQQLSFTVDEQKRRS